MKRVILLFIICCCRLFVAASAADTTRHPAKNITLPSDFTSTVVAENLGQARHIAVNTNGDIYIKLGKLNNGTGIVGLRDINGDGTADKITSFGEYAGTGIAIQNGYLYASSNNAVYRYPFNNKNEVVDIDRPELVVTDLVDYGEHNAKSIALDGLGNIYVNVGIPFHACQEQVRKNGAPCPLMETAGGIWQFKSTEKAQSYAQGIRYATGIPNATALDWNKNTNSLFGVQQVFDSSNILAPQFYDSVQLAQELFEVKNEPADFGWPYCYYDAKRHKKLLAPELRGDEKNKERCNEVALPLVAFPSYFAPRGLLFYNGTLFPEKYRNGAFVAFYSLQDRLPGKGSFIAFIPFVQGKPSGQWEVFAEGFSGSPPATKSPRLNYRLCGLAQGPDGALYVTDDLYGTVWKIGYKQ